MSTQQAIIIPRSYSFAPYGDNYPLQDLQRVRIQVGTKGNYIERRKMITAILLWKDFYVSDRFYGGYDKGLALHTFFIDAEKIYPMTDYENYITQFEQRWGDGESGD